MKKVHHDDLLRRRSKFTERVAGHDALIPGYADAWSLLRSRMLADGGVEVVPPLVPEMHIAPLILDAVTWNGANAVCSPGEISNCHENSRALFDAGATPCGLSVTGLWTGYALSLDGLWRQHSWASTSENQIVETTEPRIVYVGIRIGDDTGNDVGARDDDTLPA